MFIEALIQYPFLQRSIVAGLLLALMAPLVGIFLVVRRYSLLADALSHVSLLGIAIGIVLKISPIFSAFLFSAFAALGIEKLRTNGKVMNEAIIALFLSGSLAFSVVIIGFSQGLNASLLGYLFGSLSTITWIDIGRLSGLAILVCFFILFAYRSLFLVALDEELAISGKVNTKLLNGIFMIVAALTITASMQVVGALLVGALMVVPVLTAMQFGKSFLMTLFLAILVSIFSVFMGFYFAYTLNLASGGAIVIVAVIVFCFVSLYHYILKRLK